MAFIVPITVALRQQGGGMAPGPVPPRKPPKDHEYKPSTPFKILNRWAGRSYDSTYEDEDFCDGDAALSVVSGVVGRWLH